MSSYQFNKQDSASESDTMTIETGFNTEEMWENRSTISLGEGGSQKALKRSKSVGETPAPPAAENVPIMTPALQDINEKEQSESFESDVPQMKKDNSETPVSSPTRLKSLPIGLKRFTSDMK